MAVVLITGTSSGIGLATALALARGGHKVAATMRNLDASDELRRLADAEGLSITILPLDVDDDASVAVAFAAALAEHGRIDAVVNNAGIGAPGAVAETPIDTFRRTMETNYFGALRCIKAALPGMIAQRSGCIVNVSSVSGRVAIAPMAAYAASKHALEALSECLAQEVATVGIRVVLVEPGPIATAIAGRVSQDRPQTAYPQARRLGALFSAVMKEPTPPDAVALLIRQVIESGSRQLRYPAGPVAPRVFAWRARTSDEEWIGLFGGDDAAWATAVRQNLGIDPKL
jgi:NAD(P)-dependent dehydrogenase (short-subunit alcohol dehydrogenase family)